MIAPRKVLLALIPLAASLAVTAQAPARTASAAGSCPWAAGPAPDSSVQVPQKGTLSIPSIGENTPVFQGSWPDIGSEQSHALMHGAAFYPQHIRGTGSPINHLPGQGGLVAMLGHRTTRTHPFCLTGSIPIGGLAIITMPYGTFYYRKVGAESVLSSDWSVFENPGRFDPAPNHWNLGLKPEYLVTGACDPPHSAARRLNVVFKLVEEHLTADVPGGAAQ